MTTNGMIPEDTASSPRFLSLPAVLKFAGILLAINLLLVGWFWLSPNWGSPTEQQGLAEGRALAEAKPSPFYDIADENRRGAKKAMKLKPIVVAVEPVVETSTMEGAKDTFTANPPVQPSDHSLVARYAETKAGDRP